MKLSRYRVIRDSFAGYEVQKWRWWWPFWMECHGIHICNTQRSLEEALKFIEWHKSDNVVWREE